MFLSKSFSSVAFSYFRFSKFTNWLGVVALTAISGSPFALPTGFHQKDLVSNMDAVSAAVLPDGRILAVEKFGLVHLVKNGIKQTTPFLNWEANTMSRYEKGMMALLADPDFAKNGYIYIWYCDKRVGGNGQDRVSRFTVKNDAVDVTSEKLMISLGDAGANYHHGSGLTIGPDGKLYIASGCRGNINDGAPGPEYAANKNRVEGKILRINIPEGDIPTDNPFYAQNTGDAKAVFYYGLRNPFTMSWRGDKLWFSEVQSNSGDDRVHEGGTPGTDYGFQNRGGKAGLWTSSSANANGRAMIGSLWYTGSNFSKDWQDHYYFGNVAAGTLWAYDLAHQGAAKNFGSFNCPIDVKMDGMGAMYVTTRCQTEDQRYTTGKLTKVWYGDVETPTSFSDEQQSSFTLSEKIGWQLFSNGDMGVYPKLAGPQSVEIRSLMGSLVTKQNISNKEPVRLRIPNLRGACLLVWKNGSSQAVTKITLL
jgi:glucose/arabinose dehydrogenase